MLGTEILLLAGSQSLCGCDQGLLGDGHGASISRVIRIGGGTGVMQELSVAAVMKWRQQDFAKWTSFDGKSGLILLHCGKLCI